VIELGKKSVNETLSTANTFFGFLPLLILALYLLNKDKPGTSELNSMELLGFKMAFFWAVQVSFSNCSVD